MEERLALRLWGVNTDPSDTVGWAGNHFWKSVTKHVQTIMFDYVILPQKLGLKIPLERLSLCVHFFFPPGNGVYLIPGSLIRRVNDSKADGDMISSLGVHFKFLKIVPRAGDQAC